jgi:hypothetical protein
LFDEGMRRGTRSHDRPGTLRRRLDRRPFGGIGRRGCRHGGGSGRRHRGWRRFEDFGSRPRRRPEFLVHVRLSLVDYPLCVFSRSQPFGIALDLDLPLIDALPAPLPFSLSRSIDGLDHSSIARSRLVTKLHGAHSQERASARIGHVFCLGDMAKLAQHGANLGLGDGQGVEPVDDDSSGRAAANRGLGVPGKRLEPVRRRPEAGLVGAQFILKSRYWIRRKQQPRVARWRVVLQAARSATSSKELHVIGMT